VQNRRSDCEKSGREHPLNVLVVTNP